MTERLVSGLSPTPELNLTEVRGSGARTGPQPHFEICGMVARQAEAVESHIRIVDSSTDANVWTTTVSIPAADIDSARVAQLLSGQVEDRLARCINQWAVERRPTTERTMLLVQRAYAYSAHISQDRAGSTAASSGVEFTRGGRIRPSPQP